MKTTLQTIFGKIIRRVYEMCRIIHQKSLLGNPKLVNEIPHPMPHGPEIYL